MQRTCTDSCSVRVRPHTRRLTASCNARVRPHARRWTVSCSVRVRTHAAYVYGLMQRTCTDSCNVHVRPHARRWTASCILRVQPHAFFVYGLMHFYVDILMQALFIVQTYSYQGFIFLCQIWCLFLWQANVAFFNIRKVFIYFLIFKKNIRK